MIGGKAVPADQVQAVLRAADAVPADAAVPESKAEAPATSQGQMIKLALTVTTLPGPRSASLEAVRPWR